jgi:hypothetical protein
MHFSLPALVFAVLSSTATAAPNNNMVIMLHANPPTLPPHSDHRTATEMHAPSEDCEVRFAPRARHCPDDKVSQYESCYMGKTAVANPSQPYPVLIPGSDLYACCPVE